MTTITRTSLAGDVAVFSPCEAYRYRLTRELGTAGPTMTFLLLNPSSATEVKSDPTVARCCGFARRTGHGRLHVVNLFALRATVPKIMMAHPEPVGPLNDQAILAACLESALVIAAWGNYGVHRDRAALVMATLQRAGVALQALKVNPESGQPSHPLYLPGGLLPAPYPRPVEQGATP